MEIYIIHYKIFRYIRSLFIPAINSSHIKKTYAQKQQQMNFFWLFLAIFVPLLIFLVVTTKQSFQKLNKHLCKILVRVETVLKEELTSTWLWISADFDNLLELCLGRITNWLLTQKKKLNLECLLLIELDISFPARWDFSKWSFFVLKFGFLSMLYPNFVFFLRPAIFHLTFF